MGDQNNYADVIETLFNTFSGILEKDVIAAVVESYEGDLEQSANALMNISGDLNPVNYAQAQVVHNNNALHSIDNVNSTYNNFSRNAQPVVSYAHASQLTTQVPAIQKKPPIYKKFTPWTDQIREVISNYNNGWRILLLMRGAPGSGKTHLSQQILQMTVGVVENVQTYIMSTDDFFYNKGVYRHEKSKLPDAHMWNQRRAQKAMKEGRSPVIIDNTNIELWEMKPYVSIAVNNGYIVIIVEPHTPWAKKANQLYKKNIHNVPFTTIQRMLDRYQDSITGNMLLSYCGAKYPAHLTPPVLRCYPPLPRQLENTIETGTFSERNTNIQNETAENTISDAHAIFDEKILIQNENVDINVVSNLDTELQITDDKKLENKTNLDHTIISDLKSPTVVKKECSEIITGYTDDEQAGLKSMDYKELEKRLEQFEQVEKAWDDGENWEEDTHKVLIPVVCQTSGLSFSKPQRNKENLTKEPLISFNPTEDWSKLSAFPTSSYSSPLIVEANVTVTERKSSSTCFEIGDTDIYNMNNSFKVINAVPRDINIFVPDKIEKIPDQRMLDKSTSTSNELILMKPVRCENEEQHFKAFRRMFGHIPSANLRDVFENCCGDVNWAVEIVIDGMENKQFRISKEDYLSEDEEDIKNTDQCQCLAAYNIIPDNRLLSTEKIPIVGKVIAENNEPTASPKKIRKEMVSDASIQIKRQIENNVVISDNYYSPHCLKIRNFRRGDRDELEDKGGNNEGIILDDFHMNCPPSENENEADINLPSTSSSILEDTINYDQNDNDDCIGDVEKTVNITIGNELLRQLDKLFGRGDMKYPDNVLPKINAPMSLLNEINALWMESLTHQLDQDSKQTEAMIEQDAEFARELEEKEEQLLLAGKVSHVPDFKEIMDLDYALSLYQKEVDEWRNNEPSDMAAKLTRDKLFKLFPHVPNDILSEILLAHNNNFQETVEGVLMSLGENDILQEKNGVRRFIMNKELEIKHKYLEEQRKALSDVEWPLLPKNSNVSMEDVKYYRDEATRHFKLRQMTYQKAKEYMQRGILPGASIFSIAGAVHTKLFEQANSKAAVSLVEVHAKQCKDNATIDLHNFRVCESIVSLDLFLDVHIQRLRQRNNTRPQRLFFITGRGLHSPNGPKIKPATQRRLRERGLFYYELNPGLLAAKVTALHKLSDEIA